ncbi:hypothetical protein FOZ62_004772 [Perkinsus olseni]|uniref:Uncharacterized protein n=1 Tax=Perkinsus olseni TaxID=32597 RepID=A0A7J6PYL2_PEROL|nr:hypothetical protein FOZ62_004772 [Perkinsus olseni]
MKAFIFSVILAPSFAFPRRVQESGMWDDYCQFLNGPASVCSGTVCSEGGQACGDEPSAMSTVGPSSPSEDTERLRLACDSYCQVLNGDASFCKWWFESPVCQYGDQPCGTMELCGNPPQFTPRPRQYSPEWDEYCKYLNGPTSRCDGTCSGGGQSCGSGEVPSTDATTVPVVITTAPSSWTTEMISGRSGDAGCDDYCKSLNGETSFCKWWFVDPVCQFGDQPCGDADCKSGSAPAVPPVDPVAPEEAPEEPSSPTSPDDVVQKTCDVYCVQLNGENSFCKWWHTNPVCQHGDQPCGTLDVCGQPVNISQAPALPSGDGQHHAECDKMCQSLNDATSYCKWWMNFPVCQHGDQPCGDASVCESETWPSPKAPQLPPGAHSEASAECDSMCKDMNGDGSYCKWWRSVPVCHGGDQPCGPGACDGVAAVTTPAWVSMPTEPVIATTTPSPRAATVAPVVSGAHSMPNAKCDAYCTELNGPGSYCKLWKDIPVCKEGDQPCGAAVCDDPTTR